MNARAPILIGITLAVGATAGFWLVRNEQTKTSKEVEQSSLRRFRPAPIFELKDSKGRPHSLSEFKGKPVILHFWASWCPPCLKEIGDWINAAKRLEELPLVWIAVSLDRDWEAAHKILPEKNLHKNVISLLDDSGKVPEQFGTYSFPETYLLDSDLQIVTKWIGSQDWRSGHIFGGINQVLRTSPPLHGR